MTDSTFVSVLAEIHLARARQQIEGDLPRAIRDSIFRRYDTDSTLLQETVAYYTDHPSEFTEIYNQLLDHLHEQRDEVPSSPLPENSTRDAP
jgi:hypothetical protein